MKTVNHILALICVVAFAACTSNDQTDIKYIPIKNGNDFGYVDWEGKIIINPQFASAGMFKNGIALVKTNGEDPLYGFINEKGQYLINPTFKEATSFNEGIAFVVSENQAPKAINEKGEEVFVLQNAQSVFGFSEGLAAFSIEGKKGNKWGFVDTKGKTIIAPQFDGVGMFSDGFCPVLLNGKWGYIDKIGKIAINTQFQDVQPFINGKAIVSSNGKYGVIDEKGTFVINPQFNFLFADGDDYVINSGGKIGWADKEGKIYINPQFNDAMPFNGNPIAAVKSGSSWGYIDKDSKFVINPQFDAAYPFVNGKALVSSNDKVGIIDKDGKFLVNPQFDDISISFLYQINKHTKNIVSSVQTDYFDVASIVNRVTKEINTDKVSGFDFTTPLSQMMSKYRNHSIDYYGGKSYLFENEKINKYADLSLSVEGTIYISSGWSYKVNPDATVNAFVFVLDINNASVKNRESTFKAFEKSFSGFKMQRADQYSQVHTGAKFDIQLQNDGSRILIRVMPASNQYYENGTHVTDSVGVDTTVVN